MQVKIFAVLTYTVYRESWPVMTDYASSSPLFRFGNKVLVLALLTLLAGHLTCFIVAVDLVVDKTS